MKEKAVHFFKALSLVFVLVVPGKAQSFLHPGILHSQDDIERMKKAVAAKAEPIYAGYQLFIQNPASQYDYKMQGPLATVGRNPTVGQAVYDNDANAAHQNAVMWAITGDQRYAAKAIEIVNAWSYTLQSITGKDAVLMAGLGPFKMINAAELLRYTHAGWQEVDIEKTERHFKEVIYPVLKSCAPFANGNWEAAAIKTVMAIGVFCNDRPMFENVLCYYTNGGGNGRLTNYVINETGQIQESGRDQPHSQLGIGMLAECCAIAWNQGLDLYSYADNRLLKGFEYTAKYNLGNNDLPFHEWLDRTGKYHHTAISDKGRGDLRALYEQVYNHYVNRMGLSAPYTQQAAEKLRPEGPGKPGADHPGYGTLYFTVPKTAFSFTTVPMAPAGVVATNASTGIGLGWVASIGATNYTVKRAITRSGPFTTLARNVKSTQYTDGQAKLGVVYFYTVAASNYKGESGNAYPIASAAGLPAPWKQRDTDSATGNTSFDGSTFTVESTGRGTDSTVDETHFTYQPLAGDGEITVRYLPQLTSQFSRIGISVKESLASDAPQVTFLLYPGKTDQVEAPDWHVRLLAKRKNSQQPERVYTGKGLKDSAVTFGRLTGYFWLRLQRRGTQFTAYTSYDGNSWTAVAAVSIALSKNALIGFSVASGMANSTVVSLDKVLVAGGKKTTP